MIVNTDVYFVIRKDGIFRNIFGKVLKKKKKNVLWRSIIYFEYLGKPSLRDGPGARRAAPGGGMAGLEKIYICDMSVMAGVWKKYNWEPWKKILGI